MPDLDKRFSDVDNPDDTQRLRSIDVDFSPMLPSVRVLFVVGVAGVRGLRLKVSPPGQ